VIVSCNDTGVAYPVDDFEVEDVNGDILYLGTNGCVACLYATAIADCPRDISLVIPNNDVTVVDADDNGNQ
jgi:hypothetical protein